MLIVWVAAQALLGTVAFVFAVYGAYVVKVKLRIDVFPQGGPHWPMPKRLWRRIKRKLAARDQSPSV